MNLFVVIFVFLLMACTEPANTGSPSLEDTVQIMSNYLNRKFELSNKEQCIITYEYFIDDTLGIEPDKFFMEFRLAELNPKSITTWASQTKYSIVTGINTTNKSSVVVNYTIRAGQKQPDPTLTIKGSTVHFQVALEDKEKFIKALTHAVTLCGGKPDTF
jgi:hypothetical protein